MYHFTYVQGWGLEWRENKQLLWDKFESLVAVGEAENYL